MATMVMMKAVEARANSDGNGPHHHPASQLITMLPMV